ncbi:hypothetical protein MRX96_021256 [Rhipicephalus microplus]
MANAEPGAGIPVTSLYSCDRTRSKRLQATTDALFEELDNGNLSDVDGEFDEFDDESVVSCAPDEDPVESDTESSDDESAVNTSGSWTSRRQTFFLTTTLRPCHCSVECWVKKYLRPAL